MEASPSRTGLTEGAFWFAAAAKLLAPLLLAAAAGARSMADVVRWIDLQESGRGGGAPRRGRRARGGRGPVCRLGRDERIKSSIYTTLETVLAPVAGSAGGRLGRVARHRPGRPGRPVPTRCTCAGRPTSSSGCRASSRRWSASVVNAAVERVQRTGRPLDPPLLLVLDEVANIAPLRDLDTLASTAAGLGIQLVTVCQDLAQLSTRYGAGAGSDHRQQPSGQGDPVGDRPMSGRSTPCRAWRASRRCGRRR